MRLGPFVFAILGLVAACGGYGDDHSRVGDLLQGDALGLQVETNGSALFIVMQNSTQDGACLGLADMTSATANGAPARVQPGFTEEDDGGTVVTCPQLEWDAVAGLGARLAVTITDDSRAGDDPYRSVSLAFANPVPLPALAWVGATGPDEVHPIAAGDHIELAVPDGVVIDHASWTAYVTGTNGLATDLGHGDASIAGDRVAIDVGSLAAGGRGSLVVDADDHFAIAGCAHATCRFARFDETFFAIDAR